MEELFGSPALVLLFAAVAPFVISLLKRPDWPAWQKQLVALAVGLTFGVLALWVRIDVGGADVEWTAETVVYHAAFAATVTQGVYWFVLSRSGNGGASPLQALNGRLEGIGTASKGGGDPGAKPGT